MTIPSGRKRIQLESTFVGKSFKQKHSEADAKEVGLGEPAEETFRSRTHAVSQRREQERHTAFGKDFTFLAVVNA
jgi:hypothetical protein